MTDDQITAIVESLKELLDDMSVPKNVRTRLESTIKILQEESELSIKINKALNELDEIADDSNMQPYTRTQVWNIVSLLETLC